MNYTTTKNTAKLIEAVEVLVKANNRVCKILDTIYPDAKDVELYEQAFEKAEEELLNLLKNEIATNIHTCMDEAVTEI